MRRTLWGSCSSCDRNRSPKWKCPAAAAVYNDLKGDPDGTDTTIIELNGGRGKMIKYAVALCKLPWGRYVLEHCTALWSEMNSSLRYGRLCAGETGALGEKCIASRRSMFVCRGDRKVGLTPNATPYRYSNIHHNKRCGIFSSVYEIRVSYRPTNGKGTHAKTDQYQFIPAVIFCRDEVRPFRRRHVRR